MAPEAGRLEEKMVSEDDEIQGTAVAGLGGMKEEASGEEVKAWTEARLWDRSSM